MRVAIYARYSSDQQRAVSIDDQRRTCREFVARQGWTIVADYADAATSGSSLFRNGIQALMRDAAAKDFDVVVAEALDRFSRDQEDTAGLFKRMQFAGVRMVTIAEGNIGPLHVGLKGTMNALFLHDLAQKTHRGLRGRVEVGRSAGGVSYGYRVVRGLEGQPRGEREIHEEEAAIVRRIFRAYVAGNSPKAIAKTLNAERIAGPRAPAWSPSTIYGNWRRGTGILNNELYAGRLVWDRQRWLMDPDTGRRIPRLNPVEAHVIIDVPHLRIVDDDLWQAAKARQGATRLLMKPGLVGARRPKYLFSGLTRCGSCHGGFVLSSRDMLACFNARDRGTCTNRRSIRRQELETRVLTAMCEQFFDPEVFAAFCEGFDEEMMLLRREHSAKSTGTRRELAVVERRLKEILNALAEGYRSESWKAELITLDARKAGLTASLAEPLLPRVRPDMAEIFRRKAATFTAELHHPALRDSAREALRGFLEKIVIPPGDELLQVVGNVDAMLAAAQSPERTGCVGVGQSGCGGGI